MRRSALYPVAALLLLAGGFWFYRSCYHPTHINENTIVANPQDLPAIIKRGSIRVLVENSATSYFIYRGKQVGMEYEMLREFAEQLNVGLEIIRVSDLGEVNEMLNAGKGDIAACNLTVSKSDMEEIAFSRPFLQTREVLVQRTGSNSAEFVKDQLQLARKTIDIRRKSQFYDQLLSLQDQIGDTIFIREANENQGTEELMEKVSDGQIDYTVANENLAYINRKFYDNIDISVPVSFKKNIAFGLSKHSPLLKKRLNAWLKRYTKRPVFAYLKKKYYTRTDVFPDNPANIRKGELSEYDSYMKAAAAKYNFDWRLLAAIVQHESNFNHRAQGFGGAYGLMQFMPGVGSRYGVYPHSHPQVQLNGGMKCIANIEDDWKNVKSSAQRYKFVLASYNAGTAHIKDAQRLARKRGLDPLVWDDNVEDMVKNLGKSRYYNDPVVRAGAFRGAFTARYVKEIISRYETFRTMFPIR